MPIVSTEESGGGGYRQAHSRKRWEKQRHTAQEGGYKLPWKVVITELRKARFTPEVASTNAVLL
jgi:hypothetical protein